MGIFGTTFNFWQTLILLLVLVGAVFGVLLLIMSFLKKRKINLKTPVGEITVGNNDPPPAVEGELQSVKEYYEKVVFEKKEFIQILNKVKEAISKIDYYMSFKKVERQMKFSEEKLLAYNLKLERQFEELLKKDYNDEIIINRDVRQFRCWLVIAFFKILKILKNSFKENGFEKKVHEEFEDYMDLKYAIIEQAIKELHNDYANPFFTIPINEFIIWLEQQNIEQKRLIREMYVNAQKEYAMARADAFKEEIKLDEFVWSLAEIKKEVKNE